MIKSKVYELSRLNKRMISLRIYKLPQLDKRMICPKTYELSLLDKNNCRFTLSDRVSTIHMSPSLPRVYHRELPWGMT